MIVTVARIDDVETFLTTFGGRGVEKRREHGCRGARVFRDPDDDARVWVVFDWSAEDYEGFLADPEIPAIARELGLRSAPEHPELLVRHDH